MMNTIPGLDVIVLDTLWPSGTPRASCETICGGRLIDLVLEEVALTEGLQQVALVSVEDLNPPPGVITAVDAQAHNNPIAAIGTGIRTLWHAAASYTALISAAAPYSPQLLEELWISADGHDVAIAIDSEGIEVPLCAVWKTESLWKVFEFLGGHLTDPRKLYRNLDVVTVDGDDLEKIVDSTDLL